MAAPVDHIALVATGATIRCHCGCLGHWDGSKSNYGKGREFGEHVVVVLNVVCRAICEIVEMIDVYRILGQNVVALYNHHNHA